MLFLDLTEGLAQRLAGRPICEVLTLRTIVPVTSTPSDRPILAELAADGVRVSGKRVARLMQAAWVEGVRWRRRVRSTTRALDLRSERAQKTKEGGKMTGSKTGVRVLGGQLATVRLNCDYRSGCLPRYQLRHQLSRMPLSRRAQCLDSGFSE